jgi:hypothetical protein
LLSFVTRIVWTATGSPSQKLQVWLILFVPGFSAEDKARSNKQVTLSIILAGVADAQGISMPYMVRYSKDGRAQTKISRPMAKAMKISMNFPHEL